MVSSNEVLYGLSRKWWDFYIKYTGSTPPQSPREVTLVPNPNTNMSCEWEIRYEGGKQHEVEVDYVMLDREQWMEFCKWYNGGPVLNPKSAMGICFLYDEGERTIRLNGQWDDTSLKRRFHLREGGGIRTREIMRRFEEAKERSGETIPMKVLMEGVWPDDMANALPNVCGFPYEESVDNVMKRRKRQRREEMEEQREEVINVKGNEAGNLVGIRNLGSTCYMNASFQFLLRPLSPRHYDRVRVALEQFLLRPLSSEYHDRVRVGLEKPRNPELLRDFLEVWKLLIPNNPPNGRDGRVAPIELTESLVPTLRREWALYQGISEGVFNESREEDTHEFLQFIFQQILNSFCKEMCEETFLIMDSHIFKCNSCPRNSQSEKGESSQSTNEEEEPMWMLALPFNNNNNNTEAMDYTLEGLLRNRSKENIVDGRTCSNCGRNMVAYSQLSYTAEFLILCLGRAIGGENRLNHSVEVPLELDMKDFIVNSNRVAGKTRYQLCGVIDHLEDLNVFPPKKHFTATVGQEYTEKKDLNWFLFDDSLVDPVAKFSVDPKTVYMLMYHRA